MYNVIQYDLVARQFVAQVMMELGGRYLRFTGI